MIFYYICSNCNMIWKYMWFLLVTKSKGLLILWMYMEEMIHFSLWWVKTWKQTKSIDPISSVHKPLRSPWTLVRNSWIRSSPMSPAAHTLWCYRERLTQMASRVDQNTDFGPDIIKQILYHKNNLWFTWESKWEVSSEKCAGCLPVTFRVYN